MDAGPTTTPRRRDAAATRAALLAAAQVLMAQHGVAGTSTRDVATLAGVNQALVYRYFGSKEKLFAEAANSSVSAPDDLIVNTPLAELPRVLLEHIFAMAELHKSGDLSTLVTAANDEAVREVIKLRIETAFSAQLARRLEGPDAELRAELLASIVVGVGFLRLKIGTKAMTTADHETLIAYVDKMAAPLLG